MITTLHGDCRAILPTLDAGAIQMCVTSPPYYGLRKYSDDPREIGQEAQPDCLAWAAHLPPCGGCYVCALRAVFAEVRRVLREDGTLWLNLGDSYATNRNDHDWLKSGAIGFKGRVAPDVPEKNLLGIPWRVALALQADGWVLRNEIIWEKGSAMPESVRDRFTRSHEQVFLFSKRPRYYFDAAAVAETITNPKPPRVFGRKIYQEAQADEGYKGARKIALETGQGTDTSMGNHYGRVFGDGPTRNRRTVWRINPRGYAGSHYAVMPEALVEPCILAGSAAQACEVCGAPWARVVERGIPSEDSERPQARRAAQLWREKGLTDAHLVAMRAVGLADAGKNQVTMTGYGKNTADVQRLADEAKAALGGYYREFLFGGAAASTFVPTCACDQTGSAASIVLDPFGGSGTVGKVALRYQRRAVLIELNETYISDHIETRTNGVQVEMTL